MSVYGTCTGTVLERNLSNDVLCCLISVSKYVCIHISSMSPLYNLVMWYVFANGDLSLDFELSCFLGHTSLISLYAACFYSC